MLIKSDILRTLGQRAFIERFTPPREVATHAPFARWRDDPEGFVRHHFGERPWAAQRAAWEELYGSHRMTWRGPRKCGKSRWLEWTVCHFMTTRPAVVLTISASWHQVRNVIWSGIAELHARAAARGTPLPGKVDATQWRLGPRHFALGRATDDPIRVQGFHAASPVPEDLDPDEPITEGDLDTLLAIAREGGDDGTDLLALCDEIVDARIIDALSGSVQGPSAYWALCFNPTIEAGSSHPYARSFTDPGPWRRIAVHPEEVDDPVGADRRFVSIPILLQRPAWREEMVRQWKEDSPLYRSHVLGLFAAAGSDRSLISETLLVATLRRAKGAGSGPRRARNPRHARSARRGLLVHDGGRSPEFLRPSSHADRPHVHRRAITVTHRARWHSGSRKGQAR